jgi:choloylglycine hydrolase
MCTNLVIQYPNAGPSGVVDPLVFGARCLELSGQIPTSLFWMPRGQSYPQGAQAPKNPDGFHPLRWTNQYAFLGVAIPPTGEQPPNAVPPKAGESCFMDGMNEEGLTVGALWLPGTTYPQTATAPYIWFADLAAWLLGSFASAKEAHTAFKPICVVGPPTPAAGGATGGYVPLHFIVTDRLGYSLVVEWTDGVTTLYPPGRDTSDGVLTNAPPYAWQRQNLANYANLSVVGGKTSIGPSDGPPVGAGLTGMPGDLMSQSRFVRAAVLSQALRKLAPDGAGWLPAPNGVGGVQAEQALVNVAMQLVQIVMQTPYGTTLVAPEGGGQYPTVGDWTMWSVVRDQANRRYYYTTAFNGIMRSVDLAQLDPQGAVASISLLPDQYQSDWCVDVTAALAGSEALGRG